MSNPIGSSPSAMTPSKRLANTPENLARLQVEASKDGKPSILAKQGNDLLLLSGAYQTESKAARLSADEAISKGDSLQVDGKAAEVLHTDDGFKEVDLSHVTVAVIDTGVQVDHPAFKGSMILPGFNAKTGDSDVTDKAGHGTHVAGIIAGALPDQGVEGLAQGATLLPIKHGIGSTGNGNSMQRMADSIRYAVDHGAKVINISNGIPMNKWLMKLIHDDKQPLVDEALRYAEAKGVVVVVAAGNRGGTDAPDDNVSYPATHPTVIAVSNLDDTDPTKGLDLKDTSSTGPGVDLAAPGTEITSAFPKNKVKDLSGTSMAAPFVTGVVTQIIARHPDWTPAQIREHLYKTATDLGEAGKDIRFGHGAIDPIKAVFSE